MAPRFAFAKVNDREDRGMIPENDFKKKLMDRLNLTNLVWVDGDAENRSGKKVDIVNHKLRIAIEIKDDTKHRINTPSRSGGMVSSDQDLTIMNQRFDDHIRSANRKFKEYGGYKTILLFRTEFFIVDIFRYALEGLHSYSLPRDENGKLRYIGRKTKYSQYNRKGIGCFIVWTENIYFFINNISADKKRILEKVQIEKIFGLEFEDVPQI